MNSSPLFFLRQSIESVFEAAKQCLRWCAKPDDHALGGAPDAGLPDSVHPWPRYSIRSNLMALSGRKLPFDCPDRPGCRLLRQSVCNRQYQRLPPNGLRQLPGGFVSLNIATPNPTMRVRYLDLREQ